ncbi:Hypothetical protein NTJ_01909 [Nesidiocoris tenuis]|uniref:Uncharacterized protein n=1 Tax=Nesidiocoris tenuis TaxID=355587 RepID=A0ABN7ACX6_9HEMI|nr:Hypothetical protein NTJ_01909 [Nesidiocoris tenuis]
MYKRRSLRLEPAAFSSEKNFLCAPVRGGDQLRQSHEPVTNDIVVKSERVQSSGYTSPPPLCSASRPK